MVTRGFSWRYWTFSGPVCATLNIRQSAEVLPVPQGEHAEQCYPPRSGQGGAVYPGTPSTCVMISPLLSSNKVATCSLLATSLYNTKFLKTIIKQITFRMMHTVWILNDSFLHVTKILKFKSIFKFWTSMSFLFACLWSISYENRCFGNFLVHLHLFVIHFRFINSINLEFLCNFYQPIRSISHWSNFTFLSSISKSRNSFEMIIPRFSI